MIRFLFPVLVFIMPFLHSTTNQADFIDEMSSLFKSGNAKEIGKSFSSSVELTMLNEEDVYSKVQAEQILRDFFTKHVPVGSSILHPINSNLNYRFGVLSLVTRNGKFRVSVTARKSGNVFLITELRIESEK